MPLKGAPIAGAWSPAVRQLRSHLGEIILMIALGVTMAQFGVIGRGDETRGSRTRQDSHRDQEPSPR